MKGLVNMDYKYWKQTESESDFLMHHGVKGMKWGVRKKSWLNKKAQRIQAKSKKKGKPISIKEARKKALTREAAKSILLASAGVTMIMASKALARKASTLSNASNPFYEVFSRGKKGLPSGATKYVNTSAVNNAALAVKNYGGLLRR